MARKSFNLNDHLTEALGDTIQSAKNNAGELYVEVIPIRKIATDPDNPRELNLSFQDLSGTLLKSDPHFREKKEEIEMLESLKKSIDEQGVINPIIVYKNGEQYQLIAGERRTFASMLAGKIDIPARILTTKPDPLKLGLIQWVENIEREDLSLWERLKNLGKILTAYANAKNKQPSKIPPKELSDLLGCSIQHGVNYRHLLNTSEEVRQHIMSGEIKNIEKAALIAKAPLSVQKPLLHACISGATLSFMKNILQKHSGNESHQEEISATKATANKIRLGSTVKPNVVKILIDSVLKSNESLNDLKENFQNLDWDNTKAVSLAFKELIQLLEQV